MQRRILVVILLAGILGAYSAWASQNDSPPTAKRSVVTCRIWTETVEPSQQPSTLVHVSVENNTSEDAVISGMAARLIERDSQPAVAIHGGPNAYWSWVDPETKTSLEVTLDSEGRLIYPEKKLRLQTGKTVEFTLDLAKLKWANELSSALPPTATLYGVVQDGIYEVGLDLSGQGSEGPFSVGSNKTKIDILRKSRKPQK